MQNNKTYASNSATYFTRNVGKGSQPFPYMSKIYEEITSTTKKSHFVLMPRQMGKSTLLARLAKHKYYCGKKVFIFCHNYYSAENIKKLLGEDQSNIKVLSGMNFLDSVRGHTIDVALFDELGKHPRNIISNVTPALNYNIKSQWFGFGSEIPWEHYDKFDDISRVEWWEIPRYKDGQFDPRGWREEQIRLLGKKHFDRVFGCGDPYS